MNGIQNIVLIGAGNVATHLGRAFKQAGIKIDQVYSRTENSAHHLSHELDTNYTCNISQLQQKTDLYIVAISDDAIPEIVKNMPLGKVPVVHTSGSVDMNVLSENNREYGVFYPLQTFSQNRFVQFQRVPICVEAGTGDFLKRLKSLGSAISNDVKEVDSEQRKAIHLAAVFACNFTNFMYAIAEEIANDSGFDFDILRPLILETAEKVLVNKPHDVQTGPARRNDLAILEKHQHLLETYPGFLEVYKILSELIQKKHL